MIIVKEAVVDLFWGANYLYVVQRLDVISGYGPLNEEATKRLPSGEKR